MTGREDALKIGIADMVSKLGIYAGASFKDGTLGKPYKYFVGYLDVSTFAILLYVTVPLLVIYGAKRGNHLLLLPWLIMGWGQVVAAISTVIAAVVAAIVLLIQTCINKLLAERDTTLSDIISREIPDEIKNWRLCYYFLVFATFYIGAVFFQSQKMLKSFSAMKMQKMSDREHLLEMS